MINKLRGDFIKLNKTPFFLLHFVIPLFGAGIFFLYQLLSNRNSNQMIFNFGQLLAWVYPIIAAWMTMIVVNQEIEAGGGFFLVNGVSRKKILCSKLFYLIFCGILAIGLGLLSYHLLNVFLGEAYRISFQQVLKIYSIIFCCSLFQYFFHTGLCLYLDYNASFGVAVAEFLIGALMLTQLGELLWIFFPSAWGLRFIGMLGKKVTGEFLLNYLSISQLSLIVLVMTVGIASLLFIFIARWEGRRNEE